MHHCRMGIVRSSTGRDDRPDAIGSRLLDAVLVAAVALAGLVILLGPPPTADYREPDIGAVVLVLASATSMWWWRTAPRAALFAAGAVVVVNAAAGYSVGVVQYPVWIALYSVFARSPRRDRVGAMAAVAVTLVGYVLADRGTLDLLTILGIVVAFAVAVLLGDGTRSRRNLAASERAAAELHEREQEAAMGRLVLQERARLARELHDSVGHAINVMVMQAGVGRHVFDDRPQFAREALEHVEDVGRVALGELDAVLRVLRPVDGTADHEPASPTLAGLEALCDRIRATGREVDLDVEDVDLLPSAERATYRIVQEAVTNAARHTTSGRIRVSIARANGDVVVTIHNAGARLAPPVAGRGLVNMRERALLEGGRLECGPVPDGFRVRATLPAREVHRA
jgi:signal transduction histidine kinase